MLFLLEFNSLVLKYKEEIKTYRKQVSDLKESKIKFFLIQMYHFQFQN